MDESILKEKIDGHSQVMQGLVERADILMSSVGELSGMVSSQEEILGSISNSFDYLESIEFSREKFFGSISALKSMTDSLNYKVESQESVVSSLTSTLETFFKDYRFLEMFDSLKDLFTELAGLKEKVDFLTKSFYRNDFEKLYSKFISFFNDVLKFSSRVDNLYDSFNSLFSNHVSLQKFNFVFNSEFVESKQKLISQSHSLISDYDLLISKLKVGLEAPRHLFVSQSLNDYVFRMIGLGYRNDYIEDYLFYHGVSRELVRGVISLHGN